MSLRKCFLYSITTFEDYKLYDLIFLLICIYSFLIYFYFLIRICDSYFLRISFGPTLKLNAEYNKGIEHLRGTFCTDKQLGCRNPIYMYLFFRVSAIDNPSVVQVLLM